MDTAIVKIRPIPSPRPRVTARGTYMSPAYTAYKKVISTFCRHFPKLDGAIKIELLFCYKIPIGWNKTKKANAHLEIPMGDIDNLEKSILDALEGIAYHNDRQIVDIHSKKRYAEADAVSISIGVVDGYI